MHDWKRLQGAALDVSAAIPGGIGRIGNGGMRIPCENCRVILLSHF